MTSRYFHLIVIIALLSSLLGSAVTVTPAQAASFNVATAAELINAITTANSNGQNDTITLTASIVLTAINNSSPTDGENGLPIILPDGGSSLTVNGNGYTISRSSAGGTPNFRFIQVAFGANLTLQEITISNGVSSSIGGAIFNLGTLNIINSTFNRNSSSCEPSCSSSGGAITSADGTLLINNSVFFDNTTDGNGGAVSTNNIATITNSTFFQNNADIYGGGIYNSGSLLVTNSTITDNRAINGGGIYKTDRFSSLTIANSTIADNSATNRGGGIYHNEGEIISINNTFSDNGAADGGNIYYQDPIEFKNTIISTTIPFQANCVGDSTSIVAGADNMATDLTCSSATPVTSTMLKLSPTLADNGGPTQTLALLPGSVAIDAGDATTCANSPVSGKDQRGINRTFGLGCDVGAFEYVGSSPTVTITPTDYFTTEQNNLNLHGTGISVGDADGDPLTVTVAGSDTNSQLTANVGTTGVVIASGNGTSNLELTGTITQLNDLLAGNSGGSLVYILNDDTPISTVTLTITADDGFSTGDDIAAINVTAVNDAPVNTVPGSQSTNEDIALLFSAGNGNQISISDADVASGNLEITLSVTNGTLTLAGITGLSFTTGDGMADSSMVFTGSLTDINNALVPLTFNPNTHYNGVAVLSITSSDQGFNGTGGVLTDTDTINITINAVNDAPVVANPIPNQNATEDSPFNFQFAANTFNDLDIGDTLTYSAQLAGGGALPGWLSFNPATRTFSGTPTNSDVGTITIQVTASDGSQSTSDNFDLIVVNTNDAPVVANPIPDQNAFENTVFNYQFPINTFSDPDVGDTLTYTTQLAGGGALPVWLSFDGATRTFSGIPTSAHIGTVTVDVIANDGNGGTSIDTFNIVVGNVNGAPFVSNPIPNQSANEDLIFNFQFSATTFSDPDVGDVLTYSAQLAGGGALPGWLSFDPVTRTFSGTPTNSDVGTITIQVTASDGSQSVSDNFDLMVMNINDAPVVDNPLPDQNAFENTTFNYQFPANTFSDPDVGDALVYSAQLAGGGALPSWLSFDAFTRTFSGTPTNGDLGLISIDVIASDGNGGSVVDTFNITVFAQANPVVTRVNVTNLDGTYTIGDPIFVTITFDQNVTVDTSGGTPTILLETGSTDRLASYTSGSGTDTLTFVYTVQPGDQTPDLDYVSVNALVLNGAFIRSGANIDAALSLPTVGGAHSIAGQHNIVINGTTFTVAANTLQAAYTLTGPTFFAVTFSENVSNSGGGSNSDDVTNPVNYLLVEEGANGVFDTTSCVSGFNSNDTLVNISNVSYVPNTAVVTLNSALPVGNYRLFVCGTTSIVDLNGLPLSGDGITPGTDYIFDVVVNAISTGNPTEEETDKTSASTLPATGFAPNRITSLSAQPATLTYAELGDLWLEIPSLKVKSAIVGVPQNKDKTWDVTWLGNNIGWLNGTAFPTWNGNSVLTAHVTNASGLEGPFAALKSLKYGDQIIVHMGGVKYVYEIRNSRLVRPYSTSFAFESLPDHSHLTLITCQGYNPVDETYLLRRVVRAVLVSVENE